MTISWFSVMLVLLDADPLNPYQSTPKHCHPYMTTTAGICLEILCEKITSETARQSRNSEEKYAETR